MGKKCNYAENYPCLDLRMIHKILSNDFLKLIRAQSDCMIVFHYHCVTHFP